MLLINKIKYCLFPYQALKIRKFELKPHWVSTAYTVQMLGMNDNGIVSLQTELLYYQIKKEFIFIS